MRSIALPVKSNLEERRIDLRPLPYSRTEANNIGALFPAAQRKFFSGPKPANRTSRVLPLRTIVICISRRTDLLMKMCPRVPESFFLWWAMKRKMGFCKCRRLCG